MLAKRVIASVLVRGRTAYKGPGFGSQCTRSIGSAVAVCRTHARRGVDEIVLLDIGATPDGRGPDLDMVCELTSDCFIPVTIGGGVKTLSDIDALLRAGADKVAVCSGATPEFIRAAADRFGSQAVVVVVEHGEEWTGPARAGMLAEAAGAGELVIQSYSRDGTMRGYDTYLVAMLGSRTSIPLIVSGGCSGPDDMLNAIKAGADGVAAGALFAFTDHTPRSCAAYLKANGVEVRT